MAGVTRRRRLELGRGSAECALAAMLVLLVVASRFAAFPASVWEQDEAYLAAAVARLDVAASQPHPPFFPLWIGLGRLATVAAGVAPGAALGLVGSILGSLVVVPLVVLWRRLLPAPLAVAAAVLSLAVPGVWLLAGRAFSGTAATALLVVALTAWSLPGAGVWRLVAGSLAAGACVLVRPQLALAVVAATVAAAVIHGRRRLGWLAGPAVAVAVGGAAAFVAVGGGGALVWAQLVEHLGWHLGRLGEARRGLLSSGLADVLGHPVAAVAWCAAGLAGALSLAADAERRHGLWLVLAPLVATAATVFLVSNPAHPRYAVPLVVLSGGLVLEGVRRLGGDRWAVAAAAVAVAVSAAVVVPVTARYRREPSPVVAALEYGAARAAARQGTLVVDRRLHAFVRLRQETVAGDPPVLFDHVLELGAVPPPPPGRAVAVLDRGREPLVAGAETVRTFSCREPLLRRLAQERYLDVTVADGAVLRSGAGGPTPPTAGTVAGSRGPRSR